MKLLFGNKSKKHNFFMTMVLTFLMFTLIPANNVFAEIFTTIGGTVINEEQEPLRIDVGSDGSIGAYLWQGTSYVNQYYGGYSWGSNLLFSDSDVQKHYISPYYSFWGGETQFGQGTTTKLDDSTVETSWNVEDGNLKITQKIHYTSGEEYFEKEWKIENLSQDKTYSDFKFAHGGDTYFGGSDGAKSYWNPLLNMVYVKNPDMSIYGLMGFSGNNNSPADRYFGGQYYSGNQYAFDGNLSNTADSDYTDAGYQLQWNRSELAPGEVWTINATERWTPAGFVQVIAPSPKTAAPNSTIAYEFTVQNFREDNNGPVSDTFDISVVSSNQWLASIRGDNSVTIDGGGATKTVIVDLQVPSDAADTNTITVTATSQNDNTISNSSSLITTVNTEIKAITGVTINPSSITSGQEESVSVDINTSNVTDGAVATAELVDCEKQSLTPSVTGSGIVTSGSAILALNIPESIESGSYYIKVEVEGVDAAYDTAQLVIDAPKIVTGIEITISPTKTAYIEGQRFDSTGMEVTATYNDGTTEVITGYTVTPYGALTTSDTKVTVSYEGKTAEQLITVEDTLADNNNDNNNDDTVELPTIKTESNTGGKIKISADKKTATIIPDDGYLIKDVAVDGKNVGTIETYKFTDKKDHIISVTFIKEYSVPYYMQDGKKVFIGFTSNNILKYAAPNGVTVQFEENPKNFIDIEKHWAKENIDFVTEREIFEGTGKDIFDPQISMTRAMFVTVIGRLYERSYGDIAGNTTFSDVDAEAYYAKYVAWANENGIIEGIGNNKFSPDTEVTREQMSEIMFRFAALLKKAPQGAWMINVTYPDKAEISDWAMDSAAYCQLTNIISGREEGKFAPKATATRAEVAAVIERFVNEILE